jgi:hypothetical protein
MKYIMILRQLFETECLAVIKQEGFSGQEKWKKDNQIL